MITIQAVKANENAMNKARAVKPLVCRKKDTKEEIYWINSVNDIYFVTFRNTATGTELISCDCPAGKLRKPRPCYHAAAAIVQREQSTVPTAAETPREIGSAELASRVDALENKIAELEKYCHALNVRINNEAEFTEYVAEKFSGRSNYVDYY